MKRICLSDIELQYKLRDYGELCDKVFSLMQQGKIKPVKASGKNGKKPALYNDYWVKEMQEDYSAYVEELSYLFVPMISTSYYLSHLKQYGEDRVWLLLLNDYLKYHRDELNIPKSINERSFEIWHREKFLKEEQGKKILKRCGISLDVLNFYETTEPMAYYSHTRKTPQNMLIIENKDTFYSMRMHLLQGKDEILDTQIGTLIYGAGKGIYRSFQDFSLCAEPYMRDKGNTIYYFGDMDYEGIAIYENLASLYEEECPIKPFIPGYMKMIEKVRNLGIERLPDMKTGQNKNIDVQFWNYFERESQHVMLQILLDGKYIPQEILSIGDL